MLIVVSLDDNDNLFYLAICIYEGKTWIVLNQIAWRHLHVIWADNDEYELLGESKTIVIHLNKDKCECCSS